jgi:hypothetical protein
MSRLILLLLAIGLGVWCVLTLRRVLAAVPARKAARAGFFAQSVPLLKDLRQEVQPTGFARVAGRYRGLAFDLQALPDTLSFRKLPALWVMVTLTEPQPLRGEVHLMARATGQENFSTFGQMPVALTMPPDFPPDITLRASSLHALPEPGILARIADLFADPRLKEAVLSPKGLRLVILAEEADRTSYLIFRDAELGSLPLPAARLQVLLEALADLHHAQNPLKASA